MKFLKTIYEDICINKTLNTHKKSNRGIIYMLNYEAIYKYYSELKSRPDISTHFAYVFLKLNFSLVSEIDKIVKRSIVS